MSAESDISNFQRGTIPKTIHRRWRWIVCAVFGIVLVGWLTSVYQKMKFVQEIEEVGSVQTMPGWPFIGISNSQYTRLTRWVSPELIKYNHTWIHIGSDGGRKLNLDGLNRFRHLEVLHLEGTLYSDEDVKKLTNLDGLEEFYGRGTDIGDQGVEHIAKSMPGLKTLVLSNTKVTDACLRHIGTLGDLDRIELDGTSVTDAGVRQLGHLLKLDQLSLKETDVTGEFLKDPKSFPALRIVDCDRAKVTDDQLPYFFNRPTLTIIDLRGTLITDVGFAKLQGMRSLIGVFVGETSVSKEVIAAFKERAWNASSSVKRNEP